MQWRAVALSMIAVAISSGAANDGPAAILLRA
jgi:hypothetical protein